MSSYSSQKGLRRKTDLSVVFGSWGKTVHLVRAGVSYDSSKRQKADDGEPENDLKEFVLPRPRTVLETFDFVIRDFVLRLHMVSWEYSQ